jgi:hypothetical protein
MSFTVSCYLGPECTRYVHSTFSLKLITVSTAIMIDLDKIRVPAQLFEKPADAGGSLRVIRFAYSDFEVRALVRDFVSGLTWCCNVNKDRCIFFTIC